MLTDQLSVYLVADPDQTSRDLLEDVRRALAGGVTAVQLRAKTSTDRERFALAKHLRAICSEQGALFIVNDRIDIALASGADGIHLGTDDLPVESVRQLAPAGFVIGCSPANDAETAQASGKGAYYLGIGPVFGTQSKDDAGLAIGLETLKRRAQLSGIPAIGIGGINAQNAASVAETGAVGVAVLSAILRATDPQKAARDIASAVYKAKDHGRRTV